MNAQILAASYHNKVEKFCFISSNTVYPLTDYPVSEIDAKFEFFEKYFSYFPENTRQQAKDSALELAKVMKEIAKDDKEFMFASLANYWYSRKEV